MRVARGFLPSDPAERHAALRDYFCDKDATAADCGDAWELTLAWPADPWRHVDPALATGLAWWGDGVRYETMFEARRRSGKLLRCLYDSWTLASWSEWMLRQTDRDVAPIILHVDDHRDLGSPRLRAGRGGWYDLISSEPFALTDPISVAHAIASGAIGMGSFMTPFVHRFPRCEVRHLCQPPKVRSTEAYMFEPGLLVDTLLDAHAFRPTITLHPTGQRAGPSTYLLTSSFDEWLAGTEGRRLLLHIDLDYFNNRYDGDSDWSLHAARLDPARDIIMARIDELAGVLSTPDIASRIEDVVIAFSPGFFPAEFWEEADRRLLDGLGLNDG
ncbi:hypothetical protein [Ensifer sp. BR816]|uniref:hypothetical protein n=1 Tax=Rhizobium sp. (strain BR816) TaxID=1057002 RepID=UPI00036086A1|nr:hypothetical protein [Ensifer sp. BR816]